MHIPIHVQQFIWNITMEGNERTNCFNYKIHLHISCNIYLMPQSPCARADTRNWILCSEDASLAVRHSAKSALVSSPSTPKCHPNHPYYTPTLQDFKHVKNVCCVHTDYPLNSNYMMLCIGLWHEKMIYLWKICTLIHTEMIVTNKLCWCYFVTDNEINIWVGSSG